MNNITHQRDRRRINVNNLENNVLTVFSKANHKKRTLHKYCTLVGRFVYCGDID